MSEIREHIGEGSDILDHALRDHWIDGNLVPADEVDARIEAAVAEAVRAERLRCAEIATSVARNNAGARLVAGVRGVSTNLSKLARARTALAIAAAIREDKP